MSYLSDDETVTTSASYCSNHPCPAASSSASAADILSAVATDLVNLGRAVITTVSGDTAGVTDVLTASGGTSISSADFNSSARPGICKANNVTALNYVKELQRQLNRVAKVKGYATVTPDGEVGPATLALYGKVQRAAGSALTGMGSSASCMTLAPDADVISDAVRSYADSIGAPATVATGEKTGTIIRPKDGKEVAAGNVLDAFRTMPTIEQVAVVGVLGGIGYLLLTGKRKRRKR